MTTAEAYQCYGGPLDGLEVPASTIVGGIGRAAIRPRVYYRQTHPSPMSLSVWEPCNPAPGDPIVTYALDAMGRRLLYEKIQAA